MNTYEVQIDIEAKPEHVWDVLTRQMPMDTKPYGILRMEGELRPKARIKLWSEVQPNRAFALIVAQMVSPNLMVWVGGMPFGLFTGKRQFQIESLADGCSFSMREEFTGPLAGMITRSMPDLNPSFEKFALTLKTKAEAQ